MIRLLDPRGTGAGFHIDDPIDWIVEVAPFIYFAVLPVLCWFVPAAHGDGIVASSR
jgi:hypothetical protein